MILALWPEQKRLAGVSVVSSTPQCDMHSAWWAYSTLFITLEDGWTGLRRSHWTPAQCVIFLHYLTELCIDLHDPMCYGGTRHRWDDNHPLNKKKISPSPFLLLQLPRQRSEARLQPSIRRGWMNVTLCWPQVTSHVTAPGEGLWEGGQLPALMRLQGARCHIPGALGLPLEPPATDPSDGMRRSGGARERCKPQNVGVDAAMNRTAEGKFLSLIAFPCTTTFVPRFISHSQNCTLLNSRPYLRD